MAYQILRYDGAGGSSIISPNEGQLVYVYGATLTALSNGDASAHFNVGTPPEPGTSERFVHLAAREGTTVRWQTPDIQLTPGATRFTSGLTGTGDCFLTIEYEIR